MSLLLFSKAFPPTFAPTAAFKKLKKLSTVCFTGPQNGGFQCCYLVSNANPYHLLQLLKVNAASALCFTLSLYHISVYFSFFFFLVELNHLNSPIRSNFTLVHTRAARPCSCPRPRDLLPWRVPVIKVIKHIHALIRSKEETEPWTLFISHLHYGTEGENLSKTVNKSMFPVISLKSAITCFILFLSDLSDTRKFTISLVIREIALIW